MIASKEFFSGWTKTFTDPRALRRHRRPPLTFGGNIIETGTTSYRLAHTRAQRAATTTWRRTPPVAGKVQRLMCSVAAVVSATWRR